MAGRVSQVSVLPLGAVLCIGDLTEGFILNGGSSIPSDLTLNAGFKISIIGGDTILRGSTISRTNMIKLQKGAVYVGNTLIAKDYNIVVASKKPTYQKAADGTLWWSNVKIGQPMTRAEIDKFEDDWPRFADGRAQRIQDALNTDTSGEAEVDPKLSAASAFDTMMSFFPVYDTLVFLVKY